MAQKNAAGGWDVFATGEYAPVESARKLAGLLDEGGGTEPAFSFSATQILAGHAGWEESVGLDLRCSCQEVSEACSGEPNLPADVRSYRYQLAWAQKNYPNAAPDRATFLVQAFATLGGGFEMDDKGRLFDESAGYDPEVLRLSELPLGPAGVLDGERLCLAHPDLLERLARKNKSLSADWAQALEEFRQMLEQKLASGFEKRSDLALPAEYDPRRVLEAARKVLALGARGGEPAKARKSR